jgi:hypothetical protein
MTKQTTITIETNSLLILRGSSAVKAWCPYCAAESEMIGLTSLGVISNLDRSAVQEWLNSSEVHRSQAADGSPIVCLNSLLAHLGSTKSAERF